MNNIGEILRENPIIIDELGEKLYDKLTELIALSTNTFEDLSLEGCKEYIYQATVVRTYDSFPLRKSIVNDGLAKIFPEIEFEEPDVELDYAIDVDYIGKVGDKAFGIQIKPITANTNFGNYKPSERMSNSFKTFEEDYGGKVFIVFSTRTGNRKDIVNKEILDEIKLEIERLKKL